MGKLLDAVQGKKEAVPTLQKQDDLILQKQGGSLYEAVKKIQQSSLTPQPQTISQNPFINIPASADWTKKQPMSIAPKDTSKIDAAVEAAKKAKENADFLNSIPGIVLQTIMGLPAAAKKILLEIPAQEGGGAVLQLTGQKEMQPQTPVEKFILGNEPVKPLGEQGKEILQGFGVSEETAEKLGLPVGVAMLALDAWPGGGKTGLAKTLAETKNVSAVESILKKAGVADDLVATYSEPIAKMSKEKDVLKALDSIENIQNSTTMPKAPSELTVPKKPQQPIKPELEPLAEEARKYKSAEEFVKARGTPIYRGGEINNEIAGLGNLGSGVYFTTDAQQALSFSKTKNEKFIEAILPKGEYATRKDILTAEQISLLNKKLKLGLDKEELKSAENFIDFYEGVITPRLEGSKMTQSQLGKIMEEVTGKVGIIDDYYGAKQYLIFNPKRIMTKNQLTDIWNQAQEIKNTLENKIYTSKTGEVFTGKQLIDGARKHGAIGQPGMIDVMSEVEKDIGKSKLAKLGDYPVKTMEFVENRIRFPMFVDRVINRGWSMEDAAKDVFKYHFDYAPEGLSAFERNWLKRLFPFYTWTRNNIPLQIEQLIKQPGKYAALGKLQDTIGGKEGREEMKDLPDWMKEQLNFRIGGDNGLSLWLQLSLPVEDISKLPVNEQGIRSIVSMMSPLIKTPIEIITNKNIYFGSDIVNPELKNYPELQTAKTMNMVKNLPEPLKKFLNVKVIKKKTYVAGKPVWKEQVEMDAKKLYLLKSAFGRFYSTIEQVGGDKENIAQKLLRVLGGIPVREIDLETQRYWDSYNKAKEEKAKRSYEKSRIIE